MILARTLRLLLAAVLLLAWQGALMHPLVHVDDHGELVHLHGGEDHDHGSRDVSCDAIAALAFCAAGAPGAFAAVTIPESAISAGPDVAASIAARLAYRSQAPPQFS